MRRVRLCEFTDSGNVTPARAPNGPVSIWGFGDGVDGGPISCWRVSATRDLRTQSKSPVDALGELGIVSTECTCTCSSRSPGGDRYGWMNVGDRVTTIMYVKALSYVPCVIVHGQDHLIVSRVARVSRVCRKKRRVFGKAAVFPRIQPVDCWMVD